MLRERGFKARLAMRSATGNYDRQVSTERGGRGPPREEPTRLRLPLLSLNHTEFCTWVGRLFGLLSTLWISFIAILCCGPIRHSATRTAFCMYRWLFRSYGSSKVMAAHSLCECAGSVSVMFSFVQAVGA